MHWPSIQKMSLLGRLPQKNFFFLKQDKLVFIHHEASSTSLFAQFFRLLLLLKVFDLCLKAKLLDWALRQGKVDEFAIF